MDGVRAFPPRYSHIPCRESIARPHRKVISCDVTFPHVQHQIDSKRAKKSRFFSKEGMTDSQNLEIV
jgi:hypothetical protein